jgi:hypothetical protein
MSRHASDKIHADERQGAFIFGMLFLWICAGVGIPMYLLAKGHTFWMALLAFGVYIAVSTLIYNLIPDDTIWDGGLHFEVEDIPIYDGQVVEDHRSIPPRVGLKALGSGKKKVSANFEELDFDTPGAPVWTPDFVEKLTCPKCQKSTWHNSKEYKGVFFYKCKLCGNVQ